MLLYICAESKKQSQHLHPGVKKKKTNPNMVTQHTNPVSIIYIPVLEFLPTSLISILFLNANLQRLFLAVWEV